MTLCYLFMCVFFYSCGSSSATDISLQYNRLGAVPTINAIDNANLSEIYSGEVSSERLDMYLYNYNETANKVT